LKAAFRIGIFPAAFWDLTPHELKLCVESANDRVIAERERDVWIAWHTAFLHRVDLKHFPKLTEMLEKIRPVNKVKAEKPNPQNVGIELMNALLQLPAAPPKPKGGAEGVASGKKALDASDSPAVTDPLTVPFSEPPAAAPPAPAPPAPAPPAAESPP
jgi:hypothetical protein